MRRFEYDAEKNALNAARHGLDLAEAQELWRGDHLIIRAKYVKGEPRYAILGKIEERIYMAIFTQRRGTIRLISCHKADRRWERLYERHAQEKGYA